MTAVVISVKCIHVGIHLVFWWRTNFSLVCGVSSPCSSWNRPPDPPSCSIGGNWTAGLSWVEQWPPVAWCPTSNSPPMASTAWGSVALPWTCCTPQWVTQVGPPPPTLTLSLSATHTHTEHLDRSMRSKHELQIKGLELNNKKRL